MSRAGGITSDGSIGDEEKGGGAGRLSETDDVTVVTQASATGYWGGGDCSLSWMAEAGP